MHVFDELDAAAGCQQPPFNSSAGISFLSGRAATMASRHRLARARHPVCGTRQQPVLFLLGTYGMRRLRSLVTDNKAVGIRSYCHSVHSAYIVWFVAERHLQFCQWVVVDARLAVK
jgi:hypothetical protein